MPPSATPPTANHHFLRPPASLCPGCAPITPQGSPSRRCRPQPRSRQDHGRQCHQARRLRRPHGRGWRQQGALGRRGARSRAGQAGVRGACMRRDRHELYQQQEPLCVHAVYRGSAPGQQHAAGGMPVLGGPGREVRALGVGGVGGGGEGLPGCVIVAASPKPGPVQRPLWI